MMANAIQVSVDGQDGTLVARSHGIRLVPPNDDFALIRVSSLSGSIAVSYPINVPVRFHFTNQP